MSEIFFSLTPDNVRDNIDSEGFGYRYDDLQNRTADDADKYTPTTIPGINAGHPHNVSLKLLSGLLGGQDKYIPIKYAPITVELEIVSSNDDAVISPGKKNPHTTGDAEYDSTNTTTSWEIENVSLKCDVVTLDNSLNNEYTSLLLKGGALPLKYSTFVI